MNLLRQTWNERRHLIVAALLLILIFAAIALAGFWRERQEPGLTVAIVGTEEIVFEWSEDACETDDFPDVPARAFRDAQGRVQLIASHYVSRRMVGPDFDSLARDCTVVMASNGDGDPAMFDDWKWIHAVYTEDGTRVYALVHNEYHGHRHAGRCPSGEYEACWYNAVTLAVSNDGGASYEYAEPPTHLVAAIPYRYEPDAGPVGVFNPSNIVYNAGDGYYYALVNVRQHEDQPEGVCVMRTDDLADPASWRAWDGSDFSIAFANPYAVAGLEPDAHICRPVSRDEIHGMRHSLTYNTYLDQFLLVGVAPAPGPASGERRWGAYYSLSDDLIHWSPRRLIMEHEVQWTFRCGDENPIGYSSILDHDSPSRNFETSDDRFYLYFVRFNYDSSCQPTPDRDLVRVPVEISR